MVPKLEDQRQSGVSAYTVLCQVRELGAVVVSIGGVEVQSVGSVVGSRLVRGVM